jgi:hypothetical protein
MNERRVTDLGLTWRDIRMMICLPKSARWWTVKKK